MSLAQLHSAFYFECPNCAQTTFVKATDQRYVDHDNALADTLLEQVDDDDEEYAEVPWHLETVDVVRDPTAPSMGMSEYLVVRVTTGPAFVKCDHCGEMHASILPTVDDDGFDDVMNPEE